MASHPNGRRVNVLQADIDRAVRNNSTHCAVAEAVARDLNVVHVLVDIQTIRYSDESTDKRYIFLTPPAVQDYIIAYDAGEDIAPFKFQLPQAAYIGERHHKHGTHDAIEYRSRVRVPVYRKRDKPKDTSTSNRSFTVEQPPRTYTSSVARAYGIRRLRLNKKEPANDA